MDDAFVAILSMARTSCSKHQTLFAHIYSLRPGFSSISTDTVNDVVHPLTAYIIIMIPPHMVQKEGRSRTTRKYYGWTDARVCIISFVNILSYSTRSSSSYFGWITTDVHQIGRRRRHLTISFLSAGLHGMHTDITGYRHYDGVLHHTRYGLDFLTTIMHY